LQSSWKISIHSRPSIVGIKMSFKVLDGTPKWWLSNKCTAALPLENEFPHSVGGGGGIIVPDQSAARLMSALAAPFDCFSRDYRVFCPPTCPRNSAIGIIYEATCISVLK
jgi:hypothetical protein